MARLYRNILTVLALLASTQVRADETPQNVREICRIEVAGTLMNVENDLSLYQGQISHAEQKVKDLRTMILMSEREFTLLERRAPTSIPTFDVDEQVVALRYRLQSLRRQLQETETALQENRGRLDASQKTQKQLLSLSESLFVWNKGDAKSPRPRQLRYRHECGPYQLLCPLPLKMAEALRLLLPSLDQAQSCERYSQIRS